MIAIGRGSRKIFGLGICCAALLFAPAARAGWSPPQELDTQGAAYGSVYGAGHGGSPQLAGSLAGTSGAIFAQAVTPAGAASASPALFVARRAAGGTWGAPVQVAPPSGFTFGNTQVVSLAANLNGDLAGGAQFRNSTSNNVDGFAFAWPLAASSPSAPSVAISCESAACSAVSNLAISTAIDAAGNIYFASGDFSGPSTVDAPIFFAVYAAASGTWSQIPLTDTGEVPRVVADARGDVALAYLKDSGATPNTTDLFVRVKPAGAADFRGPQQMSTPGTVDTSMAPGTGGQFDVAIDPAGNVTTANTYATNAPPGPLGVGVEATYLPLNGTPSSPQPIATPPPPSSFVRLAVDPLGDVTAVWTESNGPSANDVFSAQSRFDSGGRQVWGAPVNVSNNGPSGPDTGTSQVGVGVDSDGTAVVTWTNTTGKNPASNPNGTSSVWAALRPVNQGFSVPTVLSSTGAGSPGADAGSAIAAPANTSGQADVAWTQSFGGVDRLYASHYTAPSTSPPGGGGGGGGGGGVQPGCCGTGSFLSPPAMELLSRRVKVDRRGSVKLKLRCEAPAGLQCPGRVRLSSAGLRSIQSGRHHTHAKKAAASSRNTARFLMPAGAERTVTVRLSVKLRRVVATHAGAVTVPVMMLAQVRDSGTRSSAYRVSHASVGLLTASRKHNRNANTRVRKLV